MDDVAAIKAAAVAGSTERPTWPMIVLRTPKGWTGPEGRRRQADRGHVALPSGAALRRPGRSRATSPSSRPGSARTDPTSCSTPTVDPTRHSRPSRPSGRDGSAQTPTRTAGSSCATFGSPTSGTTPSRSTRPARPSTKRPGCWARGCATSSATILRPSASSDPTRRRPTGSTRSSRRPTGSGWARSARPTSTRRRPGGSWRSCRSISARAGWRATC